MEENRFSSKDFSDKTRTMILITGFPLYCLTVEAKIFQIWKDVFKLQRLRDLLEIDHLQVKSMTHYRSSNTKGNCTKLLQRT